MQNRLVANDTANHSQLRSFCRLIPVIILASCYLAAVSWELESFSIRGHSNTINSVGAADKSNQISQVDRKGLVLFTWLFGEIPPLFIPFLKTVEKCGADVVIMGDNAPITLPHNVRHHNVSWEKLVQVVETTFNLHPGELKSLRGAGFYKVCDFKVFVSILFPDLIKTYEFFGWVDNDVFVGNFEHFIKHARADNADFYSGGGTQNSFGPLSIMRNTPVMSTLSFLMRFSSRAQIIKDIFDTAHYQHFDEWGGAKHGGIGFGKSMTGIIRRAADEGLIVTAGGIPIANDWSCNDNNVTGNGYFLNNSGCPCDVDVSGKRVSLRSKGREVLLCHLQLGKKMNSLALFDFTSLSTATSWQYSYPAGIRTENAEASYRP